MSDQCQCNQQPPHGWNENTCMVSPPGMSPAEVMRRFPSDGTPQPIPENQMTQPELKPCAFCGKKPQSKADLDPITYGWSIKCCGWVRGENELVSTEKWNSAYCWKQLAAFQAENKELEALCRETGEALEKTLVALVSYKHYIPEPYKQNPIYIMGSVEAEKLASEALSKFQARFGGK